MELQQLQQQQQGGYLKVNVGLHNVIICAPTTIESNVLAIRGEFEIALQMNPPKSIERVLTELKQQGVLVRPGDDIKEVEAINTQMALKVQITGFEVCICKNSDLRNDDFKKVRKREILAPIQVEVVLKKALVLSKDLRNFIDRTSIQVKLSNTNLKVCFKDFGLLQTGLQYQLDQLPKSDEQNVAPVSAPVLGQEVKTIEDL